MRKEGDCLEKEIMQGTIAGARKQGKPRMRWMDNMEEWTGMPFEDLLKKMRDRRKWSRLVHEATNPRIEDGWRQDKTDEPGSRPKDPVKMPYYTRWESCKNRATVINSAGNSCSVMVESTSSVTVERAHNGALHEQTLMLRKTQFFIICLAKVINCGWEGNMNVSLNFCLFGGGGVTRFFKVI